MQSRRRDDADDFAWREIARGEFQSVEDAVAGLGAMERYEQRLEERATLVPLGED